jgi:hypothetical protein
MGSPAARLVVGQPTADRLRAAADSDALTAAAPPLHEADTSPRRHSAGPRHADPEASLVGPTPPSRLTAVGNAGVPAPGPRSSPALARSGRSESGSPTHVDSAGVPDHQRPLGRIGTGLRGKAPTTEPAVPGRRLGSPTTDRGPDATAASSNLLPRRPPLQPRACGRCPSTQPPVAVRTGGAKRSRTHLLFVQDGLSPPTSVQSHLTPQTRPMLLAPARPSRLP